MNVVRSCSCKIFTFSLHIFCARVTTTQYQGRQICRRRCVDRFESAWANVAPDSRTSKVSSSLRVSLRSRPCVTQCCTTIPSRDSASSDVREIDTERCRRTGLAIQNRNDGVISAGLRCLLCSEARWIRRHRDQTRQNLGSFRFLPFLLLWTSRLTRQVGSRIVVDLSITLLKSDANTSA